MLRFLTHLYEPGTEETQWFFHFFGWFLSLSDIILALFLVPAHLLTKLTEWVLPISAKIWFPVCPAANFCFIVTRQFASIPLLEGLAARRYDLIFPGVIDWRYPVAFLFWLSIDSLYLYTQHWFASTGRDLARAVSNEAAYVQKKREFSESLRSKKETQAAFTPKSSMMRVVIDDLKSEIDNLQVRLNRDPFTGLYSKNHFLAALEIELTRAKQNFSQLSVMMMDIDDFKKLNDTYGHPVGDMVIKQVANVVKGQQPIAGKMLPARYGGEEIAVIFMSMNASEAEELAVRICNSISDIRFDRHPELKATVSIGLYSIRFKQFTDQMYFTPEDVIKKADQLLYDAKHQGENRVVSIMIG
ncbi:MAG: GGDEF domain-containing protein [Cyanobacteria bacterium]|nr:GGDEF domain-containing protein [Cyanobacteriota bacterium]